MHKFEYDSFQKKAMSHIDENYSVVVSAPTGSGKTVIADYVIAKCVKEKCGVIYTAPIKALSNQKYRDFTCAYGNENVGIVTGDVVINAQAPILIMTTEIFRNSLFDHEERFADYSWVIFDEIHYIDDFERGTVWEEALMFFPDHMKMLCLSATIPNLDEFVAWVETVHGFPVKTVIETQRAVPLTHHFCVRGEVVHSLKELKKIYQESYHVMKYKHVREDSIFKLIRHIKQENQIPCIFFVFARRRCEELAKTVMGINLLTKKEKEETKILWHDLVKKFQLQNDHTTQIITPYIECGIAYHHAGMLPTLKEAVERLFTSRLIKLIFTTETFALGINMPARTVIFDELRKFYGFQFENIKTRDYYQMAGRAGRRGMDECGYVYSCLNPFRISFQEVCRIITGTPEEVRSQFNSSYATLLHLYEEFKEDLYDVYLTSLHYHQSSKKEHKEAGLQIKSKIDLLKELGYIHKDSLTTKGKFACQMFGYELPLGEMFEAGMLENFNERELIIALSALVFEPRKNTEPPELTKSMRELRTRLKAMTRKVYRLEQKRNILVCIKKPYFHLAPIVDLWAKGADFEELQEHGNIDEGEIVRYIRMIIQLLRELKYSSYLTEQARERCSKAMLMINRDVIDAEQQLRA